MVNQPASRPSGRPSRPTTEDCFLQAIDVAHAHQTRTLELRAATDLAQLWCGIGSGNDPRVPLEPILAAI
jgi:hypothetical protein